MSDKEPVTWSIAPKSLIGMMEEIIREHRKDLLDARIGVVMRSESQKAAGGQFIGGKASKVPAHLQPLMERELDFVIWIAEDIWMDYTDLQRHALVHHELEHCGFDVVSGKPIIKPHDIEEFFSVVALYGNWRPEVERMGRAIKIGAQAALPFEDGELPRSGYVVGMNPDVFGKDVTVTYQPAEALA